MMQYACFIIAHKWMHSCTLWYSKYMYFSFCTLFRRGEPEDVIVPQDDPRASFQFHGFSDVLAIDKREGILTRSDSDNTCMGM